MSKSEDREEDCKMPSSGHDTVIAIINSQHLPAPGLYKNGLSAVSHGYRRGSRGLLTINRLWEMESQYLLLWTY